jgi:hypothetical protein
MVSCSLQLVDMNVWPADWCPMVDQNLLFLLLLDRFP